ncbi:MAG: hypothetical protein AAFP78_10605 [Pseudomonadota bacterium]
MLQRSKYSLLALLATGLLVACGDPDIFDRVAPERSGKAVDADWPKLADTPDTPPQGVYTEAAPDPATGEAVQIDLSVAAESAETRRQAVSGPVE